MGMYCFVGIMQNPKTLKKLRCPSGTRGNGKTMTLVYYGYKEYKKGAIVFSNFKTKFSYCASFYNIIKYIRANKDGCLKGKKIVILLTEFYKILTPYEKLEKKTYYMEFINQIRKFNVTIYLDTQRLGDISTTMRENSNKVCMPFKIHKDGKICNDEQCNKKHYIIVEQYYPEYVSKIALIDTNIYGKLYNSFDNIQIQEPAFT